MSNSLKRRENLGRKHVEASKAVLGMCLQKARAKGWCEECCGTGFVTYWESNEKTKKLYGNVPQEFSYACPVCGGTGGKKENE